MVQSKKGSVIETIVNIIIGLIVSFCIQIWLYTYLNIPVTINKNLIITAVFFIASFVRGYFVRRFFNNKKI